MARTALIALALAALSSVAFAQDAPAVVETEVETASVPAEAAETEATEAETPGAATATPEPKLEPEIPRPLPAPDLSSEGEAQAPEEATGEEEEEGWDPLKIQADDSWYVRLLKTEIKRVGDKDLFGNSAQLPRGYLSIKYDWTTTKAGSRFDSAGNLGPVMSPISFEENGNTIINVDLGMSGEGGGHGFMVSYGIIDPVDWFFELPFTYMNLNLNPVVGEVDDQGNHIAPGLYANALGVKDTKAYNAADFIYDTMPKLGRASPATSYQGEWLLGDIRTGFSWNYFRNSRISFALVPKVAFPTGKVQHPNNSVIYGTGPAIETGLGGWAMGASHVMDVRLFRLPPWLDVILTTELGVNYGFPQEREYPTNFEPPLEIATQIDADSFPDLSNLDGTFNYTPGFALDWMAQLSIGAPLLSVGFAYGIQFSQTPWMEGDPDFIRMARALELVGQSELHAIQIGVTTTLLPLYIPVGLGFSYRKAIAGRNVIVLDDYWQFTVTGLVPIEPFLTFESEE
jgi:hypothetical protein